MVYSGIDEGLISGTLSTKNFQKLVGFNTMNAVEIANVKANISAMVQIGSVGGALLAFTVADRWGRLWATRQLCLMWILGIVIFMTNGGRIGQIYAGRFIAGIGIGETTVIAPVYLAEIAPKAIRGLVCTSFSGAVYLGIMLAYFSSWGSSLHIKQTTTTSWQVPTSLHLIFAGLIFVLSWFNYESPRYLMKCGKNEQAISNLSRIRNLPSDHPTIIYEIQDISRQLAEEQEATLGQGFMGYVKEIFTIRSNLYRVGLGIGSQLCSQWSGSGSVTLYIVDFFALLGVKGQQEKLYASCIFGVVKFISAMICALFLIDFFGRKRSLLTGISLQAIAMIYIAAFLTAVPDLENRKFSLSEKRASTGAIAMIYISGFGWAMGWNSIQYLLNSEIYPLRIRAISSSMVMSFHFINQYGNSRAVPPMLLDRVNGGLGSAGTFWFFAAITTIGGLWAWFFIPETAGLPLEMMDELFKLKWYQIGLNGRKNARLAEIRQTERRLEEKAGGMHVEVLEVQSEGDKRV